MIRLLLVSTQLTLFVCHCEAATAVSTYRFESSAEPSFRYVSGDLPCEILAHLSGHVSIATEEDSGKAQLRLVDVLIHSAHTEYGDSYCDADIFEGVMLSSISGGFDTAIPGERLTPLDIQFGPSLSENWPKYMRQFTFTVGPDSLRLSGSSIFYGDDGGSYSINGLLLPVPEAAAGNLIMIAFAIAACCRQSRLKATSQDG